MKILLLLLLISPLFTLAQNGINYKYNWDPAPTAYVPEEADKNEDAIVISEKHHDEYLRAGGIYTRCELIHLKKILLTDSGIEQNNRFYISTDGSSKVFTLKARVIQPSGKIIELSQENIIESKDDNGKVQYRYFVFEGIEKGSTIEYLHYVSYKLEKDREGKLNDCRAVSLNGKIKKKEVDVIITFDKTLTISSYTTNGIHQLQQTSAKNKITWSLSVKNTEAIPEEKYAFDSRSMQRFYYNVNTITSQRDESVSWKADMQSDQEILNHRLEFGDKVYGFIYYEMLTQKELYEDELDLFINTAIHPTDTTSLDKLRAIEAYIKTDLVFDENASIIMQNMLKTRRFSESGSVKLMAYAANALKIDAEIVFSCNRMNQSFPEEFSSNLFFETMLIYFPDLDLYYTPYRAIRIGAAPKEFITNRGLFISEKKTHKPLYIGSHASQSLRIIKAPATDYTVDQIETKVTIDPSTYSAEVGLNRSVKGYFAESYQSNISYLNEEEQREVKEEYLQHLLPASATIDTMWFENDRSNDFNCKPFVGHAVATSSTLVSEASNKLLVNIGTLIGEQADLYQEKPTDRKLPVDFAFAREYSRTIRLNIPEGYRVSNLSDLSLSVIPEQRQFVSPIGSFSGSIDDMNILADELSMEDTRMQKIEILTPKSVPPPLKPDYILTPAEEFEQRMKNKEKSSQSSNYIPVNNEEQNQEHQIEKVPTRPSIGFVSNATLHDNQLVINVMEWYDALSYNSNNYNWVVDVMNASADFNNLVVVLEKK